MQVAAVQSAPFTSHPELQGQLQYDLHKDPHPAEQVGPGGPEVCVIMTSGDVVVTGIVVVTLGVGKVIHGHGLGVIGRALGALEMQL